MTGLCLLAYFTYLLACLIRRLMITNNVLRESKDEEVKEEDEEAGWLQNFTIFLYLDS